jgi:hypothetical protein
MLPKNPRALLNNLEAIEQGMDEKHNASLKARPRSKHYFLGCLRKFQEASHVWKFR